MKQSSFRIDQDFLVVLSTLQVWQKSNSEWPIPRTYWQGNETTVRTHKNKGPKRKLSLEK